MNRSSFSISCLLVLAMCVVATACPMCKDTIPNSDAQSAAGVPAGFNWSIYYMLGGVFTVAAFVGRVMYKATRTSDR